MAKKKLQKQIDTSQNMNFKNFIKTLQKSDGHEGVVVLRDKGQVPFYLSSGDDILDIYMSNKKWAGVPGGRITEFNGLEGCVTEDTLVKIKIK